MPSFIEAESSSGSINAFTSENKLVMNMGQPVVAWSFRIKDLEEWLTTLEEAMLAEPNVAKRWSLERIYFSLKAAHTKHLDQHNEVVTNAPNADDLMQYLASYAACLGTDDHAS